MKNGLVFALILANPVPFTGGRAPSILYGEGIGMSQSQMWLFALLVNVMTVAAVLALVWYVRHRSQAGGRLRRAHDRLTDRANNSAGGRWRVFTAPFLPGGLFVAIGIALRNRLALLETFLVVAFAGWLSFVAYQTIVATFTLWALLPIVLAPEVIARRRTLRSDAFQFVSGFAKFVSKLTSKLTSRNLADLTVEQA